MFLLSAVIFCTLSYTHVSANPCIPVTKQYGTVCVCNATYCDDDGAVPDLKSGEYAVITSSESGSRFELTTGALDALKVPHEARENLGKSLVYAYRVLHTLNVQVNIDSSETYQRIQGFGGSFTDSAGINILNISSGAQNNLMKSYFGPDGLNYNLGRVPIGGSDFSDHGYAYNEFPVNDKELFNFSLTAEDFNFKIPLIKLAKILSSDPIELFAATWSPPGWMKTNGQLVGFSELKKEYYQTYADYHLRFLQEYNKNGIDFYAISSGNEPLDGLVSDIVPINSLGWNPKNMADWIANNLGPTLNKITNFKPKLYMLDDQYSLMEDYVPTMLAHNKRFMKYVDGIAFHWYMVHIFPISSLTAAHENFGLPMIVTEACQGFMVDDIKIKLGSWSRGEEYLKYIIENINNFVGGWIDWNLALNTEGGPNWNSNFVDAPIIVDSEKDEFYKQPMYYAFGHIAKYVPRGSVRISTKALNPIPHVAFQRPDGLITVVALNNGNSTRILSLDDLRSGYSLTHVLEAHSIATVVFRP